MRGYCRVDEVAAKTPKTRKGSVLVGVGEPAISDDISNQDRRELPGLAHCSVVDAVRCAIEVQNAVPVRNAGVAPEERIEFRVGIHVGDVVEESDGDLMGDGVNVAARLEGVCEPGGVILSGAAYEHARDRLKEPFVDLGEKPLKNIARPVRVYALKHETTGGAAAAKSPAPEPREPPRLSLVVLPFANIGGDQEQEYFVDGVTESLTTDLSRISGAFVIGRSTAFSYKGKSPDLKQIGRELNVRYVLEGSVQRAGNRLRVNVQLIEAETGKHLWAERFDKPVSDLFDMQDEIVARLANQLQVELFAVEARRAEQKPNPDSMDLVFQGRSLLYRGFSSEMLANARRFYAHALELDAGNVEALVGVGTVDFMIAGSFMADDPRPLWAAAEATLTKALALAPNHARAHGVMGSLLCESNRAERGIEELEHALAIDPNYAGAHAQMGLAQRYIGRAEKTEAHVLEALRLSPRDRIRYFWLFYVGGSKANLGEWAQALPWLRKSIDTNRNYPLIFFYLPGCLAHLGRLDEARSEVEAGLALDPKFTLRRYRAGAESDNAVYLTRRERIIEGMRVAGVPEE
jgi:TolB-like protein